MNSKSLLNWEKFCELFKPEVKVIEQFLKQQQQQLWVRPKYFCKLKVSTRITSFAFANFPGANYHPGQPGMEKINHWILLDNYSICASTTTDDNGSKQRKKKKLFFQVIGVAKPSSSSSLRYPCRTFHQQQPRLHPSLVSFWWPNKSELFPPGQVRGIGPCHDGVPDGQGIEIHQL